MEKFSEKLIINEYTMPKSKIMSDTTKKNDSILNDILSDTDKDLSPLVPGTINYTKRGIKTCAGSYHDADITEYCPAVSDFALFYFGGAYYRIKKSFHRRVYSTPGNWISLKSDQGVPITAVNTGSYNYLGYSNPVSLDALKKAIRNYGTIMPYPRSIVETVDIINLEKTIEKFLRFEHEGSLVTHNQGFETNSSNIPVLLSDNSLVISDEANHSSIITGIKASRAKCTVFSHNSFENLEYVLQKSIIDRFQDETEYKRTKKRHYDKIIVMVEGIYSMEGSICEIPKIIALKEKYKFYLFVDEAHSIGCIGENGGGVADYYGLKANDIDLYVGTFSKSTAACGGYIGSPNYPNIGKILKQHASYMFNSIALPPICIKQIQLCFDDLKTVQGKTRIVTLKENANYFRTELKKMGFVVCGSTDSPVVPVMLYSPMKILIVSEALLQQGIASVVVGFPAVKLALPRIRFCISSSHSKKDIDYILRQFSEIGDTLHLKYNRDQTIKDFFLNTFVLIRPRGKMLTVTSN